MSRSRTARIHGGAASSRTKLLARNGDRRPAVAPRPVGRTERGKGPSPEGPGVKGTAPGGPRSRLHAWVASRPIFGDALMERPESRPPEEGQVAAVRRLL